MEFQPCHFKKSNYQNTKYQNAASCIFRARVWSSNWAVVSILQPTTSFGAALMSTIFKLSPKNVNSTYCEMLLGYVVLVEVDTGSVVLLHGIAGQQLSDKQTHIPTQTQMKIPIFQM